MKKYKITFTVDQDQLHTLKNVFGDMSGMKNFLLSEAKKIFSESSGDAEVIQIEENSGNVKKLM